jgi:hypothetical protein
MKLFSGNLIVKNSIMGLLECYPCMILKYVILIHFDKILTYSRPLILINVDNLLLLKINKLKNMKNINNFKIFIIFLFL